MEPENNGFQMDFPFPGTFFWFHVKLPGCISNSMCDDRLVEDSLHVEPNVFATAALAKVGLSSDRVFRRGHVYVVIITMRLNKSPKNRVVGPLSKWSFHGF